MPPVTTASRAPGPFRLTDEHEMLRDAVRVLADEQVAPRAADIDRTAEFPEDLRRLLADHDILALPFTEEHGGIGGELLSVCLAVEQLSRACQAEHPPELPLRGGPGVTTRPETQERRVVELHRLGCDALVEEHTRESNGCEASFMASCAASVAMPRPQNGSPSQ